MRQFVVVPCPYCGAEGVQVDVPIILTDEPKGTCNACKGKVKLRLQLRRAGRRVPKTLAAEVVGTQVRLLYPERAHNVVDQLPAGTVLHVSAVVDGGKLCLYDPTINEPTGRNCYVCRQPGHTCRARVDFARVAPALN